MKTVLIKCNDIGMCSSINRALKKLVNEKLPISTSIFFTSPYYEEVLDILKENPQVSCGIYLSLISEWRNNSFKSVSNPELVPSIIDKNGSFFPNTTLLLSNQPKVKEIEVEIYAQIERALNSGLRIDYIDFHTSLFFRKMEIMNLVIKAAKEYKLCISRLNSEILYDDIYKEAIQTKKIKLISMIDELKENSINVLVAHIGLDTEEMKQMENFNNIGLSQMALHRQAELDALCSADFKHKINSEKIRLITYKDLVDEDIISKKYKPIYKTNSTLLYIGRKILKKLNKI